MSPSNSVFPDPIPSSRWRKTLGRGLATVAALALAFGASGQTTRNAATFAELNSAIAASSSGDTVNITGDIVVTSAVTLNKSVTIEGNGRTITVPVNGVDDAGVVNASASGFRVFSLSGSVNVTIEDLVIKGGNTSGGGAISVPSGNTLRLNGSTVSNSRSPSGGGGISNQGTTILTNSRLIRNSASFGGGFLNNSGGVFHLVSSTLAENRSESAGGGGGGGENTATMYVNNSTFSNNKSTEIGGGINNYNGTLFVANSTFSGNVGYGGLTAGGAIGVNGGTVTLVNSLFAYNYVRTGGSVSNPTSYALDDVSKYAGSGTINSYFNIFSVAPVGHNATANNIVYGAAADGSDNSIFSGGLLARLTDGQGLEIGTASVFQPFLVNTNGGVAGTLKLGSFALDPARAGTQTGYSNSPAAVFGYFDGSSWVNLVGSNADSVVVTTDQLGNARAAPITRGATSQVISDVYMLRVNRSTAGTVSGGSLYGDVYSSGSGVTLTAIPNSGQRFTGWTCVEGCSGTASTANPYSFSMPANNLTLVPSFTALGAGEFIVTYVGNGNTGGEAPATQTSTTPVTLEGPGTLVRTGYSFSGWNTNANGVGTAYAPGASYAGPTSITLYAQWLDNSATTLASVATGASSGITSAGATLAGEVSADGGATVTARGIVYATSPTPTLADASVAAGSGVGGFSAELTGLSPNTTYFARAYATNSVGTAYGSAVSFTTAKGTVAVSGGASAVSVIAGEPLTVSVSLSPNAPNTGPVPGDGTSAPDVRITTSEAGTGCLFDLDAGASSCTLSFNGVTNTSGVIALLKELQADDPEVVKRAKASIAREISAEYLGSTGYDASSAPVQIDEVTVSSAPTRTELSSRGAVSGAANSVAGESVRLTATVTTDAPSTIPPRGRVLFTRDSDVLGQVSLTAAAGNTATAEFVAPARPVGTETYYAFFLNNDDFVGSDDDAEHSTVKASTTTLISSVLPASPEALQTVTVSAQVAAVAPGAGTPTGTITISGTDTTGCVITLPATSCELSFATKGSKTLTATYGGDDQFLASGASSDTETVTVVGIPVTLTLTGTTPSPHYYGTAYTVSYTLSGGDGSFGGDVTVSAAPGGASCTGTVSGTSGSCEIVVPNGNAGDYTLTGAYAGDSTDATATSATLSHTIAKATTALTLSGNTVDPIDAAEQVTVSLNLSMPNGVAPLAGTIAVSGDNTTGCSVTLTGGEAMPRTCQLSFSTVGSKNLSATFAPSDTINVAGSTSNPITYEVVRAITTTEITGFAPASGTAQVGDAVTVSFEVSGGVQPYDGALTVEYGSPATACLPVSFNTTTGQGSCQIPATALQLAGDYAVRVAYAGDADDVPSDDSETLNIAKRATTTTLASTPASSEQAGRPVTWTVGVSAVGGAATTPIEGTVFVCPSAAPSCDAGSAVCAITLPSTSCELSYDLPQTVSLVARYAGDANYAASTSSADSITIEKRTSTIAITSDLSAQTPAGAPVTVAFDVDGGHQTYDGQVTVTATLASPAASASCGPVSVDAATGVGSCVIQGAAGFVRAGSWSVVAEYAGDDNDTASTSAAVTHPVGRASTSVVLVSDPDPSVFGQPFNLTATVTSSTGIVPTGQVEFFNHLGVSYGTVTIGPDGTATLAAPSNLSQGFYNGSTSPFRAFKAVFIENPDFDTSVDPSEAHTIGRADVSLSLASATNPSDAGDSVTFTGTAQAVAPSLATPTGTLTITAVGPAPLSTSVSCTTAALAQTVVGSSSASCALSLPAAGSYSVTATYDNTDGNFNDITTPSAGFSQGVQGLPTTLAIGAVSPTYGDSVSLPLTVTGGRNGNTGTVDVSINGNLVCNDVALTASAGICSYLPPAAGSYSVEAIYNGDGADVDDASSTATSSFTVAKQTPTVGLSLSPDPVAAGATLTATVSVGTSGTVSPPTGTITVSTDGSESGCSVAATGGSCSLTLTATGARTLTASYAGDANFNGDSDTDTVTVEASTTTAAIGAISPATPVVGEPITISFSLSGGVVPYSGAVSFLIDPTPADTGNGDAVACPGLLFDANTGSGTCTLVAGLANAGVYGLSLSYAGDGNDSPASDSDSLTVGAASASLGLSSGGSSVVGQTVSVSALVSRLAPATGIAEGSVQITATGPAPSTATQSCTIASLLEGEGSCGFTFNQVGSYSLSASYTSADGNTQSIAGPAGTIAHSVERAAATISLGTVTPASPRVGQSTTVSFSVAGGFGGNSGLVDISTSSSGGAGPGCSGLAADAGTCVLSFATAGSYTVTATYNASGSDGDDSIGATDVLVGLTVQPAEGGLDVTVSDTTPEAGQSVTIGATVQTVGGTAATGTITVTRGGSPVCTITLPSTSCTVSFGSIGSDPLVFSYSGDANYAPANTSVPLTVSPAATTLAITGVSPTSLLAGQSSTVSYTVSGGFAGNTGTVVVTATSGSNTATCSAPAAAGSCDVALARAGVWSFAATYNASGSDVDDAASSASTATTVSVTRTPTVTVLTVDPAAGGPFGTTVTLSAQVDRNAPGVGQPQGMVTFLVDGASIGEAPLSPSGQAVFSTSTLPVGSRVLRAQYNGNDDYLVSFDEKTFQVSRKAVTLAITGSSVNPSAIAESVVFSYSFSTAPGTTPTGNITLTASTGESCVGTIAAGQCAISFSTGGNRSVTASYAGDALHAPASSAAFAHSVAGTPTTLVFASGNPASATFGDLVSIATQLSGGTAPNQGLVTVTASAAGQTSVSCSAAVSGGASSCSLAGLNAGTWSVSASYAGDSDDAGSNTAAPISLVINPASQTIVFGAAPSLVFNGSAGTLSATGGASGNPVVFSSTTPATCSVVGNQVTPLAAGTCTVAANQAGSANYSAADPVTQTILVAQASQTIVFGPAPSLVFNGPAGTLSATGGASGNPVVFGTSTPSVCSVSGTQVTPLAVGSCIVTANQAGTANYAAAAEVTQAIVIGNGSQTITFGPNPGPLSFGGPVAQVSATASSGLPVSFGTSSPSVCTISGTGATTASLTILAAGSCVVTADQAGNGSFSAAPQVTQSVQIDRASQTITFAAIADAVAGSGPIALNASASSGLAVSFGTSSSASVCTVNSGAGTVTPVGPGTCVVQATQAGNGNYQAADAVERSFTVTAAQVDLSMVKSGRYLAGGLIQWNLAIGNAGPGAATAATVLDSLPAAVTGATWTCAASVGSSCAAASGTGDINTTVNVAAGGSVVIEITATLVDPNAVSVVNSASVQPAAGVIDTNPGNNVSTLDLRVALFSDGFESAAVPGGLLKALDSLSVDGATVESKLRGAEPVDIGYYVGEGKALLLQAREVHGLVEVRLLQKTQAQPWARSRWIELWPGDRVHLDYVNTGPQLEARVAVGQ